MALSTTIVGYLLLFVLCGLGFVLLNIFLGSLLRPSDPHEEKLEVYECGEPTIGSSYVQFDLRFYVVALLFIIFDVEVAFFFPWAVIYGKATQLAEPSNPVVIVDAETGAQQLSPSALGIHKELGVDTVALNAAVASEEVSAAEIKQGATKLIWTCIADISVFFAVLLVGFAYVWKRGDLDWVRAISSKRDNTITAHPGNSPPAEREMTLSA
ncbi:MAG: NADH-quinone oxidoreductase subunit A [Blastopirellula sp.]|nr:MAG: NADH-quinone oxidoreductase subunit A [Blastopirellula sp.]